MHKIWAKLTLTET